MGAAPVLAVFKALGAPKTDVRFVGGCVRDAVLSRTIKDIDVATPDEPAVVIEKLDGAGLKAVPTGLAHGTVTAVAGGQPFEITSLRKDTACDGRHAAVEFTTDWVEDASRRDFTFNALSLRQDGELFDPFGGVEDAKAGRVRFVGDPRDRIQEDYLRILRYFRFIALYGTEAPDADILAACRTLRHGLAELSTERVRDEFIKLLNARDPDAALAAMADTGVLSEVFPEARSRELLRLLVIVERDFDVTPGDKTWRQRWVAMFDHAAPSVARRMRLAGKDVKSIEALGGAALAAAAAFEPIPRNRFLHAFADAANPDCPAPGAVLIACARENGETTSRWSDLMAHARSWHVRHFPLGGADVHRLGIEDGPRTGALLRAVEQEWVDGGFVLTAADLRARLESLAR
ncbi:MAG: CCA tRNA nucleotidyltransferase [Alphaproteobacteria bacterium]|nr:CCA tRNA nucleotidyltransferase [Alphaproteobacteria bacterium]